MSRFSALCGAAAIAFSTVVAVQAGESQLVEWGDLVDQTAQIYEDPYRDLSYTQIDTLREYVGETAKLEQGMLSGDELALSESRIAAAKGKLAADGIDVDWLVKQRWIVAERREQAATAANPDLDGQNVVLSGYAIPAPSDEDGTRIAYLVPERGMCSHMPPPNANQMIRARINTDWNPSMMHEPVRLSGKLSVQDTKHAFRVVDGEVPMRASFVLDVSQVETMEDLRTDTQTTNEWATSLAERLRASGQVSPQQSEVDD